MKSLNKETSDALDNMFQGLPKHLHEAAIELFIAESPQELRLSAKAFQLIVRIELRRLKLRGVRHD